LAVWIWLSHDRCARHGPHYHPTFPCRLTRPPKCLTHTTITTFPSELLAKAAKGCTISELQRPNVDINARDRQGNTALHGAVLRGSSAVVQRLLRGGASPQIPNVEGYSPLDVAILNGRTRIVTALLDAGASAKGSPGRGLSPLHLAAFSGNEKIVATLLARGAQINRRDEGRVGHTPLHYASQEGNLSAVLTLLKGGADMDAKDSTGFAPLVVAVAAGHLSVVRALLSFGADPNSRCSSDGNSTPLHTAVAWNATPHILRLLLRSGANPKIRSKAGLTPAELAVQMKKEVFAALLG